MIIVDFAGQALAFTDEEFKSARERGRELVPSLPPANGTVPVVDAAGAEAATAVPATWWLEAARRGDVEHFRFGKYVRFRLREVLEAAKERRRRPSSREAEPRLEGIARE